MGQICEKRPTLEMIFEKIPIIEMYVYMKREVLCAGVNCYGQRSRAQMCEIWDKRTKLG